MIGAIVVRVIRRIGGRGKGVFIRFVLDRNARLVVGSRGNRGLALAAADGTGGSAAIGTCPTLTRTGDQKYEASRKK